MAKRMGATTIEVKASHLSLISQPDTITKLIRQAEELLDPSRPSSLPSTMVVTMVSEMTSRIVKASEFKAKCLKLMDEVAATGDTITVTKNGRPVVEVRAVERPRKSLYGRNRGRIQIVGDLDDYEMEWEMQG